MTLSKSERDALSDSDFAAPGKRKLPINDERHTRLAWDQVDGTGGLSAPEKQTARERILKRAKELGIDTKSWSKLAAVSIQAMSVSLEFPANDNAHPNKMPFSGVLTRVDQPSDAPPGGAGGRLVYLTSAAAKEALPSLLGMAIDFTPSFDGHDAQRKVGIITDATLEGDAIHIAGFVYAADFPAVARAMKANKDVLGFSFEMTDVYVADPAADPLVIVGCVFTGAAVLRKDKAAYTTTSLAANADLKEVLDMDPEELKKLIGGAVSEAVKPITSRLDTLEASSKKIGDDLAASAEVKKKVAPLAKQISAAADALCAAGVGTHVTRGHAKMLENIASDMEAQAALGTVPHSYPINGYYAAREDNGQQQQQTVTKLTDDPAFKALKDQLDAANTKIADLTAAGTRTSNGSEPQRKTLSPMITDLLKKVGIVDPENPEQLKTLNAGQLDEALKGLPLEKRWEIKRSIERAKQGLAA